MNTSNMASMCDEFDDSDEMEDNDDEFGALRSILSWDEAEDNDNGGAVNRVDGAMVPVLRDRGNPGSSGMSAPPDMVQFSTKDGVSQFHFLPGNSGTQQSNTNLGGMSSARQITSSSGKLTLQLPLPTPISSFCQEQLLDQNNVGQGQQTTSTVSPCTNEQQQHEQDKQQEQVQQQFAAQNAANFAQLFAQQAGNMFQQQPAPVPMRLALPTMQNMQQAQPSQQNQQQQVQLPFTADPNMFLQQLQFAQFQQQLLSAQAQQQHIPNAMHHQLQAHFSQATGVGNVPLAAAAPTSTSVLTQPQPSKKRPKESDGQKKLSTKAPPKETSISNPDVAMVSMVSASDTDAEAYRTVKMSRKSTLSESKRFKVSEPPPIDMSNMTEAEKVKVNRDRNREHARNTRLRKKAYLEKLKDTVDELCRERDSLVTERSSAANLLVEMHNTRTEVLMSFFALRTSNEKRRKLWSSILDESCFVCVMPVTPYRSFAASEVQVSKCLRMVMGIDGMMADAASLHVLFDSLVDRARHPYGKILFRYTLVTEEAIVAGNQMMARWVMSTTNAVACGAKIEVTKQGMLCCKFNSAHKIVSLELMFDVMAFMLQLKQASGSDSFSVVPNTVQTCQKSFDRPMVVTLAEPPYTIIQVNEAWTAMTGYTSDDVAGKESCSILQSSDMDKDSLKSMMHEIRFKRSASAMLVNTTKSGDDFSNFLVVFPLSTDSRITYYLGLTLYTNVGKPAAEKLQAVATQALTLPNHKTATSENLCQMPKVAPTGFFHPAAISSIAEQRHVNLFSQVKSDSGSEMLPPTLELSSPNIFHETPRTGLGERIDIGIVPSPS